LFRYYGVANDDALKAEDPPPSQLQHFTDTFIKYLRENATPEAAAVLSAVDI